MALGGRVPRRRAAVVPGHGPTHGSPIWAASSSARTSNASPPSDYNDRRPFWFYVPIVLGGLAPGRRSCSCGCRVGRVLPPAALLPGRMAAAPVGGGAGALLHAVGRQAAALHPAGAAAARPARRADAGPHRPGAGRQAAAPRPGLCRPGARVVLLVLAVLLYRARPLLFALSPTSRARSGPRSLSSAPSPSPGWSGSVATRSCRRRSPRRRRRWCRCTSLLLGGRRRAGAAHGEADSFCAIRPTTSRPAPTQDVRAQPGLLHRREAERTWINESRGRSSSCASPQRVLCVMPAQAADRGACNGTHGLHSSIAWRRSVYFNPSAVRLRTLLCDPQPERDLETVWLISNR